MLHIYSVLHAMFYVNLLKIYNCLNVSPQFAMAAQKDQPHWTILWKWQAHMLSLSSVSFI